MLVGIIPTLCSFHHSHRELGNHLFSETIEWFYWLKPIGIMSNGLNSRTYGPNLWKICFSFFLLCKIFSQTHWFIKTIIYLLSDHCHGSEVRYWLGRSTVQGLISLKPSDRQGYNLKGDSEFSLKLIQLVGRIQFFVSERLRPPVFLAVIIQ